MSSRSQKKNSNAMIQAPPPDLALRLSQWFEKEQRRLPWRSSNPDPYKVWISEVMLQQTTVRSVIPFFLKFIERFPDLKSLATATEAEVFELWSGLGYYSRARNLLRAARAIHQMPSFPSDYRELLELPGFGPYTARSVASLAFNQAVGVVDGNVIRVWSRLGAQSVDWWTASVRESIQTWADQLAALQSPRSINQALMELGASICTPQKPACPLCPVRSSCRAHKLEQVLDLPKKRPRKVKEIWLWKPQVSLNRDQVFLTLQHQAPVLKNQKIFPGSFQKLKKKPKSFDLKHCITHHEIYVKIENLKTQSAGEWVPRRDLAKHSPSSLLEKVLSKAPPYIREQEETN